MRRSGWRAAIRCVAATKNTWRFIRQPISSLSTGAAMSFPRPGQPSQASPTEVGYGAKFNIRTPNSTDISSVVFVRPGSSTHSFDMEQRLVSLAFQPGATGTVKASAPPNGSIAPPGYYMLFLINQAGVPSTAKFVHLTSVPKDRPPEGEITSPARGLNHWSGPVGGLRRARKRSRRRSDSLLVDLSGWDSVEKFGAISWAG